MTDRRIEDYCLPIPANQEIAEFDHQVAGHVVEKVRRYGATAILKPMVKIDLFLREVKFYVDVFSELGPLSRCLPAYRGVVLVDGLPCLALDDLTVGYTHPCLIDIKMGQQTFEPTASASKKAREQAKYPHQESMGFRITGMKVWQLQGNYENWGKEYGRSLCPGHVQYALGEYFWDGSHIQLPSLLEAIAQLEHLLVVLEDVTSYQFYCSSLLFVRDSTHCTVKMIDFAHVLPSEHRDEGYLYGLRNLLRLLKGVVESVQDDEDGFVRRLLEVRCKYKH